MNPNSAHIDPTDDKYSTYDLREFRTVEKLVQEYPDLISEHALRWALRFRHDNGLEEHVTRLYILSQYFSG